MVDQRRVRVAYAGLGRGEELTAALRARDVEPELTGSADELFDDWVAALVLDGFPNAATLRRMADTVARHPTFPILVLGPVAPDVEPLVALASGAAGYVAADASADDVGEAVRSVLDGDVVLPPSVAAILVRGLRRGGSGVLLHRHDGTPLTLTHREWQVLVLLRQGWSTAEIAQHFVLAHGTVRTHVSAIVRKLGAKGRASISPTA